MEGHSAMDRPEPPYDEMYAPDGRVRPHYAAYSDWLVRQPDDALRQKRAEADSLFHRVGITFAVYGEQEGNERLIPFDIVPRVLSAAEWQTLAAGLRQRVRALNSFVADIYHEQDILRAAVIAADTSAAVVYPGCGSAAAMCVAMLADATPAASAPTIAAV